MLSYNMSLLGIHERNPSTAGTASRPEETFLTVVTEMSGMLSGHNSPETGSDTAPDREVGQ